MTGRFGCYAELAGWTAVLEVAEAQTAPISMVERPSMDSDWAKTIHAVLLTKTDDKAFSIVHLTPRGSRERRLGGSYTQNTRDPLQHVWETRYAMWYAREHWLADVNAGKDFLTSLIERGNQGSSVRSGPVVTRSVERCGWRRSWITHQMQ